jgi:glucuronosyltransferase
MLNIQPANGNTKKAQLSKESFSKCYNFRKDFFCCHRYRENAQRLSRIYRDQPFTPLEQAVYWTEYMIRHKGAPHLRSAVLDLAWYQYLLLDVTAVLALAVGSVVLIVYMTLRAVLGKICGSGRHKEEEEKTLRNKKRN